MYHYISRNRISSVFSLQLINIYASWRLKIVIEDLDCDEDGTDEKHRDCCVDSDWNHLNDAVT